MHKIDTPQKLAKDWEIQEWGKMLVDECEGLGIKVKQQRIKLDLIYANTIILLFMLWLLLGHVYIMLFQVD